MPTYEYKCKGCGNEFEYQQRISDPPKSECEQCGGALEKLISRSSFMLKGSGWYKDLYSSPKPASGSSESGGASKDSASKDSGGASKDSASASKDSSGSSGAGSGAASPSSTATASK